MKSKNIILTSTYSIVKKSKDVKINFEKIEEIAKYFKIKKFRWDKNIHFYSDNLERLLNYFLLIDCNNFCFWLDKNNKIDGYFILSSIFKDFFLNFPEKANLKYFSKISLEDFKKVFKDISRFYLIKKRWEIIKRVSNYIVKNYKGSFYSFIKLAKKSAKKLIEKIYKELYSFDDIFDFKGRKIYFLKRAQHLTANIWGALDGKDVSDFYDLDYLTAFADYKLPQILNHFDILKYSQNLKEKLKRKKIVNKGSRLELELRANTIWAIEYLKEKLQKKNVEIYSFEIDWFLWNLSHKIKFKLPHHRTLTFYY